MDRTFSFSNGACMQDLLTRIKECSVMRGMNRPAISAINYFWREELLLRTVTLQISRKVESVTKARSELYHNCHPIDSIPELMYVREKERKGTREEKRERETVAELSRSHSNRLSL